MKKLVSAAVIAAMTAGAFAEVSVSSNARVYSDVFTYESATQKGARGDEDDQGTNDNGKATWGKDTKHSDDVTVSASGENVGSKIVLSVSSNTDNSSNGSVGLTSYQLWGILGDWRVDAGAYDQRLSKNLNDDGNWGNCYSGYYKPGLFIAFDGAEWGKDAGNLTTIKGAKKTTNFQISNTSLLNKKLALRGVMFLSSSGTVANVASDYSVTDDNDETNAPWIFNPFALGGVYKISNTSQLAFNVKLNSITQGAKTDASYTAISYELGDKIEKGKAYTASVDSSDGTVSYTKTTSTEYYDGSKTYYKKTDASYKPQNSVWTLNFDYYNKLSDTMEIEAAYTLGASIYTNNGHLGAYKDNYLVRDYDVFAHAIDFRLKNKLSDALSLTAIANISYVQGTAYAKSVNRNTAGTKYKDSLAKSYKTGAAGTLGYYATFSLDYAYNDTTTFQVQSLVKDTNLFSAYEDKRAGVYRTDYLDGLTWNVRPAVLVGFDKSSQLFAGVDVGFSGFHQNATGEYNEFKVTTSVPLGLRVKL